MQSSSIVIHMRGNILHDRVYSLLSGTGVSITGHRRRRKKIYPAMRSFSQPIQPIMLITLVGEEIFRDILLKVFLFRIYLLLLFLAPFQIIQIIVIHSNDIFVFAFVLFIEFFAKMRRSCCQIFSD